MGLQGVRTVLVGTAVGAAFEQLGLQGPVDVTATVACGAPEHMRRTRMCGLIHQCVHREWRVLTCRQLYSTSADDLSRCRRP